MADDTLPIVFKTGLRIGMICFGCAAVSGVAAYAELSAAYPQSVRLLHVVEVDGRTFGWIGAAVGVLLAYWAVVAIVRGCPRLSLDESGIVFRRCFGRPVQIPWNRFEDVEVKRMRAPGARLNDVANLLYVVTTDGRQTCIGEHSDKIENAIRRVAARMKAGAGSDPAREASA